MQSGQSLGGYRILKRLGAGGMGEVWRATDTRLGREVALKVLPAEVADDPDRLARFEREAKVLASLNHPNIATLYGLESAVWGEGGHAGREGVPRLRDPADRSARDDGGEPAYSEGHAGREGVPRLRDPGDRSARDDDRSVMFLVIELVEGEDLSQRLERGPVPVDEAIPIALQIAEALEAAHEAGVIHRDLKPANIRIRPDGTVKVLDFGLAKDWTAETGDGSLSLSPTLTRHATAAGVILGTAAYMSPEQARGKSVDRRSDIWAFGVVLWEMLTGSKLFGGETVSDVLASVLKEAPPLDVLPPETPAPLRRLVARCLDKDQNTRLRDIGEARIALAGWDGAIEDATRPEHTGRPGVVARLAPWAIAGAAAIAAVALGVGLIGREEPASPVYRFEVPPPPDSRYHLAPDNPGPVAVSPDGTKLAYSARSANGVVHLWVRALDEEVARELPGTESAQYPFWSPDSRRVGFFARNKLRVVEAAGGPPLALCDAPDGKGGSWSSDGVIVFAPSYNSPLHRVAEAGGESVAVTGFDPERRDNSHRHPRFLPDGRHFLYMARSGSGSGEGHAVMLGSLDGSVNRLLFRAPAAVEFASGHLLFLRDRTLMARPFDPDRLEFAGEAFPVAETVTMLTSGTVIAVFSASTNGVLTYLAGTGDDDGYRLVWRDRAGTELGELGDPTSIDEIHLVPGGELAAAVIEESGAGTGDIWLIDLARGLFSRFTFGTGYEAGIAPTPDGKALIFVTETLGSWNFVRKEIGGAGEGEVFYTSEIDMFPTSVSPDGSTLVFYRGGENTNYDLWTMPLDGDGEAAPFLQTDFDETGGMISPDGRWLAFTSNESGSPEIYVTAFPERGRRWQVSPAGGLTARWADDGSEILYHAPDGTLTAVRVEARMGGLLIGEATPLFATSVQPITGTSFWAIAAGGERVVTMESTTERDAPNLSVVVNWPDSVRRP